jgi:hypothetical protein
VWAYRSRAVRRAFDVHDPEKRILVRYEGLRNDTAERMERICEILGLAREGLSAAIDAHRFERLPRAGRGTGQRQRLALPGAWRERLSAAEQEAMHEVMSEALEEFGYQVPAPAPVG